MYLPQLQGRGEEVSTEERGAAPRDPHPSPRLGLDTGRNFFTERVVKRWTRLPGDMVESPSMKVFKKRVDVAVWDVV